MTAGKHNYVIEEGTDWSSTLWLSDEDDNPKDLTDYSALMQIREQLEGPVIKELASGTEITITPAEGKIELDLTVAETRLLQIRSGVYDLELTSGAPVKVTRLLEGSITVTPEVTR